MPLEKEYEGEDTIKLLKGNRSKDANRPENVENVQTFPSAGFTEVSVNMHTKTKQKRERELSGFDLST